MRVRIDSSRTIRVDESQPFQINFDYKHHVIRGQINEVMLYGKNSHGMKDLFYYPHHKKARFEYAVNGVIEVEKEDVEFEEMTLLIPTTGKNTTILHVKDGIFIHEWEIEGHLRELMLTNDEFLMKIYKMVSGPTATKRFLKNFSFYLMITEKQHWSKLLRSKEAFDLYMFTELNL